MAALNCMQGSDRFGLTLKAAPLRYLIVTQSLLSNPLARAQKLCHDDMRRIDDTIRKNLETDVPMIPALGHFIIGSGGKRLRPLLCLLSARLFGYRDERHIPLAVIVEFLHTASLLHDDVVDEANLRRGQPSANGVWGNQASVLVGDFLFARALHLIVSDGDPNILQLFSRVTSTLAEGEVLQLAKTFHLGMDQSECLEVIERKTAILFVASSEVGARVAGRSVEEIERMAEFGTCLGVAFQLMDDALDYSADAETVGKPVGHDLEEGKITLPLIHAMHADDSLRAKVEKIAERGEYAEGEREWVRQVVQKKGGVDYCRSVAGNYAERAKQHLPQGVDGEAREILAELADFSARRLY
jgi:octaprenyl-diphosphate synthase